MAETEKKPFRVKRGSGDDRPKWARYWYGRLRDFHRIGTNPDWRFSEQQVVAFLRVLLSQQMPAWKRLKVVENLCWYRDHVIGSQEPNLDFILVKLRDLKAAEAGIGNADDEAVGSVTAEDIEGIVGVIDPNECEPLQSLRRKIRLEHKSLATEEAYVGWIKRFMHEFQLKSIECFRKIGSEQIESFLTRLAVDGAVAASTQDQAYFAIRYFYEYVLLRDVGKIQALRSKKPKRLPVVLSREETIRLLAQLGGRDLLLAELLYGCGMRLKEVLRLRIKDVDFDQHHIVVRRAKGGKDRIVPLPEAVIKKLEGMLVARRLLHDKDLADGVASVYLPFALSKKYPNAHREWKWQYVFAASRSGRSEDREISSASSS